MVSLGRLTLARSIVQPQVPFCGGKAVATTIPVASSARWYLGEADGFFPGVKESAKQIPEVKFVSFPGLDHGQTSQRSDLVLPQVTEFLSEVSRTVAAD